MGSNFYEMLENPLGRLRSKLLPGLRETEMIELLRALADRLDELLYPLIEARRIRIWSGRPIASFITFSAFAICHNKLSLPVPVLSPTIAYVNSIEKWDDHSFHAGGTVIFAVGFYRRFFRALYLRDPILSYRSHSYIDNTIII